MTREEAVKEIEKAFEPAFANYIITALTEGATVSDKEQGTAYIQAIYTEALEEGIRCAMCTNTIKSDTGCDGGCIVDAKMYNKVMTEINSRLLRRPPATPQEPKWIPVKTRKLTDAEEQYMLENSNYFYNYMFDCQLPEDGEEVLVTTSTGEVTTTTFYDEGLDGCCFEFYEDDGDVIAWMPLPEPYKGGE